MITWFWYQIVSSFIVIIRLMSLYFHILCKIFPKAELFINLKKSFSKSFKVFFISISDFNHTFWWSLMNLCIFFKTSPYVSACFKFLMWIIHSFLTCKLATSFLTCIIFVIFNNFCIIQIFRVLNISFEKVSFFTFFIIPFYETFVKFRKIFNPIKTIYRQLLWHLLPRKIIYVPIL